MEGKWRVILVQPLCSALLPNGVINLLIDEMYAWVTVVYTFPIKQWNWETFLSLIICVLYFQDNISFFLSCKVFPFPGLIDLYTWDRHKYMWIIFSSPFSFYVYFGGVWIRDRWELWLFAIYVHSLTRRPHAKKQILLQVK